MIGGYKKSEISASSVLIQDYKNKLSLLTHNMDLIPVEGFSNLNFFSFHVHKS